MTNEFHPTSKARRYIDGDPDVGQEEALNSICDLEFDLRMPYEIKVAKLKDQLAQGKVMYDAEVAETDALKLRLVQSSEGIKGLEEERELYLGALNRCSAAAGNPNPATGCRLVIFCAKEVTE